MIRFRCLWNGPYLWDRNDRNGLVLTSDGKWCVHDTTQNLISDKVSTEADLLSYDPAWSIALEKIKGGLTPNWYECTCGAWSVMGNDWEQHTPLCLNLSKPSPFAPKNNDGRSNCYKCSSSTRAAGGGQYTVCSNKECDWFDK